MPALVQVDCLRIEKKTVVAQKQPVYFLSLHWSDGRVSEVEKPHSAFVDLRTFLKKTFYGDRRDVQIPEVPALKKFEIGTSAKKDEKKKKWVEEFCMQLANLPEVDGKSPVREFFVAYDDSGVYKLAAGIEDDGAYSTAELLDNEVSKAVRLPQEKIKGTKANEKKKSKEKGQDGKQLQGKINGTPKKEEGPVDLSTLYAEVSKPKPLNYIEVDLSSTGKSERLNHGVPSPETLYAEIGPSSPERPKYAAPTVPPHKGGGKPTAQNAPKQQPPIEQNHKVEPAPLPYFTQLSEKPNQKQSRREVPVPQEEEKGQNTEKHNELMGNGSQYQNFPITSPNLSEKKLYIVTESFIPNTAFSQFLSVEDGDIVEVQAISGDKFFCTLHATHFRPMEGWLPKNILQPCTSSALSNSVSTSAPNLGPKGLSRKISTDGPMPPPHTGHSNESFVPIMPIPPKPSLSSYSLEGHPEPHNTSTSSEVKVMATADYKSDDDNILSFEKGLMAELLNSEDPDWWCIRIGFVSGWVPANCWQLVQETSGPTSPNQLKIADAPYFIGSLSRCECEDLLMQYGLHLDFVVRESSNLVGQFALSVRHSDHVHHFPIALTEDNKYYIGKHRFKTIENVISYYQRNDLFIDEDGSAVHLGNPFVWPSKESFSMEEEV